MKNLKKIFFYSFFLLLSQNIFANNDLLFFENIVLDTITPPSDKDSILTEVDEMPQFAGCENLEFPDRESYVKCAENKMLRYIYKGLKYPKEAREEGIGGLAVIQFIVEENGAITNAKIVRDPGGGCGVEALRVIETMPAWTPGKHKDEVVRVQYTLPVRFTIENGKRKKKKKKSESPVFKVVDQMPRFPGCEDMGITDKNELKKCSEEKMLKFIYGNLKHPPAAREDEIIGKVIVQFFVEKDGSVNQIKVVRDRDPEYGFGEEALRVMKLMPKWIPGMQQGEPVRIQYTLPIRFKL